MKNNYFCGRPNTASIFSPLLVVYGAEGEQKEEGNVRISEDEMKEEKTNISTATARILAVWAGLGYATYIRVPYAYLSYTRRK